MKNRFKVPSSATPEINAAADDQRSIEGQLDEFERLIKAIYAVGKRSATSTLMSVRSH